MAGLDDARQQWQRRYTAATAFMAGRAGRAAALIEVAAQHPLRADGSPGPEFEARLRLGVRLYAEFAERGPVEMYVPGSRHRDGGTVDPVSLSDAGGAFLRDAGIPAESVHGEDLNQRYRGDDGVYGSADECFVTASYYRDGPFGPLLAVVSPGQLQRKMLHYLAFGVLPLLHTAPTLPMYHDPVGEVFDAIPRVLTEDPDLRPGTSAWADHLRAARRP
ncbi:hypothetical protein [Dactylosporangium sp. NPDC050588]|uniref:hypothetical protein n=1 Tax=Dactylosporangium sp. NPDC050588 TaxID=3157211 RepID=UPI0033E928F1